MQVLLLLRLNEVMDPSTQLRDPVLALLLHYFDQLSSPERNKDP